MIILTKAQADDVRGKTAGNAYLEPVEIKGGIFVLPEAVLSDQNHAIHHDFLSSLPKREIADSEWIRTED